jgi:hypothetical protein
MTTRILPSLSDLSSNELHARLGSLRAKEREGLVSFLHCLAEIERRKVHAELGFPSIFKKSSDCTSRRYGEDHDADPSVQWGDGDDLPPSAPRQAGLGRDRRTRRAASESARRVD